MNTEKVPLELRASSRWVSWKYIGEQGKKILDSKTNAGALAWPSNAKVWSSFTIALKRAKVTSDRGIGLVVETPFVGVDFDHCIEDGILNEKIAAIIAKLPKTYGELSPSGTGIHLWYRCAEHAKLPGQAIGLFEIYARGRFLTVTGNQIEDTPNVLTEISLAEALNMFRMADPSALEDSDLYTHLDNEEGFWSTECLIECLETWKACNRNFEYLPLVGKYAIPCPGNTNEWSDGSYHESFKDPKLSRQTMVWLINGWPVFSCFHAHCQGKTWKDIAAHYDPDRLFNASEWLDEQIAKFEKSQ